MTDLDSRPAARTRDGDAGARIADSIRAEILDGTRPPGSRIRQEDLAERFGASRVPVREALRQLEFEGLVTVRANSGAWVSQLTLAQCEEVYRMRERVEPLLLEASAPRLTSADLDELDALARRISEHGDDTDAFLRLDRAFHLASYGGARTWQLAPLIHKLWNITTPYRRAYVSTWSSEARRIANEEHHLIVAALRDGDLEDAGRILEGHIRRTRRRLDRTPEIFAPDPH